MKIVFVSNHACMRMNKIGMVLIERGYDIHLITHKITQYTEIYSTISVYQDSRQLNNAIVAHKDAELFHVHNEPSWYVTAIKQVFDKPVIIDVHDSILLRRTAREVEKAKDPDIFRISADERNNFQLADGLVYVCKPMQRIVNKEFTISKPNIVLPSGVPRSMYRNDFFKWEQGLVYEGRIDLPEELSKEWSFFNYCNYIEFAEGCREHNIPLHIYTPRKNENIRRVYGGLAKIYPPFGYRELIHQIGRHDWGFVGNCFKTPEWKNGLSNKLFDYMAACLPVICWNADTNWNFIKKYGIGIKVNSFKEIVDRWKEHRECRKNMVRHRTKFILENYIERLEKLYQKVLDGF